MADAVTSKTDKVEILEALSPVSQVSGLVEGDAPKSTLKAKVSVLSGAVSYLQGQMALDKDAALDKEKTKLERQLADNDSIGSKDDEEEVEAKEDGPDSAHGSDELSGPKSHASSVEEGDDEDDDLISYEPNDPANPKAKSILGIVPTVIGSSHPSIVLAQGTVTGPLLRMALKAKLLAQNTEIQTSSRGAEELLKKGPELFIHTLADITSAIATTPLLLAAAYIDEKLVGTFDDVKHTYHNNLTDTGSKVFATVMAGLHFIMWVMKHAAVLMAAGLTTLVNTAIFLIDKIASGTIAIAVNTVFAAARFVRDHKKAALGLGALSAIAAGIALALKYFVITGAAVATGVGFAAVAPYIAMGLGALLALYLVVRGARFVYNHCPTIGRFTNRLQFDIEQRQATKFMRSEARSAVAVAVAGGKDPTEARLQVQEQHLNAQFGSPEAVKYLGEGAMATARRVIGSRGASNFACAFGRDLISTFSNWSANDLTITQRALVFMSDEELKAHVVDYQVDKSIKNENDRRAVKAALLASLRAQKVVAEQTYYTTIASEEEKEAAGFDDDAVLSTEEIEKQNAIAIMLSGSDAEILKAMAKYADRKTPKAEEGVDLDDEGMAELLATPIASTLVKTADGLPGLLYSDSVTVAIREAHIEDVENAVKVRREVEAEKKEATAMASALLDSSSGFSAFLVAKGYTVEKDKAKKTVSLTLSEDGDDDSSTASDDVALLAIDLNKFDAGVFLGEAELDFDAETKVEEVLLNENARALVQLFRDYNKLGKLERLSFFRQAHAGVSKPTPKEEVADIEEEEDEVPEVSANVRVLALDVIGDIEDEREHARVLAIAVQLPEAVLKELSKLAFAVEEGDLTEILARGINDATFSAQMKEVRKARGPDAQQAKYTELKETFLGLKVEEDA